MTSPLGARGSRAPHCPCADPREADGHSRVGAVVRAVRGCWEVLLKRNPGLFESDEFVSAASVVRKAGESAASRLPPLSDHLRWLARNGFSREDARQIRYEVELWHAEAPALALVAASIVAEETQSSLAEKGCVPFVGDWPVYEAMVAAEMNDAARDYGHAARTVYHAARKASTSIGAAADGTDGMYAPVTVECLSVMCDATVLACALRRMFVRAEIRARRDAR